MTTVSIQISDNLAKQIDQLATQSGQAPEDFIARALEQQVSRAKSVFRSRMSVEDFRAVQGRLRLCAEAAGYTSEDEILTDLT